MKRVLVLLFALQAFLVLRAQETIVQYLSGTDKDHTVKWDFMCTTGRNSGAWTTIPVPSNWELQGFGTFNYYQDKINPEEQGRYRFAFSTPSKYKTRKIFLVFAGVMTDAEVRVNGKPAGPVHQGGYYQFKYEIDSLLQFDKPNRLEVTVSKHSANESINQAERKADFWQFGGIFRPVYLEILPTSYIERVAIDAKATGDFNLEVFGNIKPTQHIEVRVLTQNGGPVDIPFKAKPGSTLLHHRFTGIKLWNPEEPNRYQVVVSLMEKGRVIHKIRQSFGFRTAELRIHDGFYVNGKKIVFKGVCRHSEWPESGRTLSRKIQLEDIGLMKEMNMNAVRMSHYPPDKEFLDLCDSLGLFVLDELTGWQSAYDSVIGLKLVREMVIRDVNHPCVVIWDNGNEGGWNRSLDGVFAQYDPQNRLVIHPWERFNGTNTKHYPDFAYLQNEAANHNDVFFPTEFMHGLFDGGSAAGLEDFWSEMMKNSRCAGGFLWSFHDEGVLRSDQGNQLDVAGNGAPDGILGPHREKEASFYAVKEIWSPVYIHASPAALNGDIAIPVENRYLYTNLSKCSFEWKLLRFPSAFQKNASLILLKTGKLKAPALAPGEKGMIHIPDPAQDADALSLTAYNEKGETVCSWSWAFNGPLKTIPDTLTISNPSPVQTRENENGYAVTCDGITYFFDQHSGFLQKISNGKAEIPLDNGPALAGSVMILQHLDLARKKNAFVVSATYKKDSLRVNWIFESGRLPRMEYQYQLRDSADFAGICFHIPEEDISSMEWLGRGPYRVWKNRLAGQQLGVWQKLYNDAITGERWQYPEFKGWHANIYWVTVKTKETSFTVYTDQPDQYLEMLKPARPTYSPNDNTSPPFPEGNFGFMKAISPIGTKFQSADRLGPQSLRNGRKGNAPVTGTLYFDFRSQ
jgi:hypothetical protein